MSQEQKIPRPVSAQSLRNAALRYIDRFATSRENLRQVLMRRVQKSNYYHETSIQDGIDWIEEILNQLEKANFINDKTYAEGRAGALHRRGTSLRVIKMKLMEKGVSQQDIDYALSALEEESDSTNLERDAAIALAKRRRLGPWRDPSKREELKEKDLAAMARAGFSYDLARDVIEADSPDDLF